MNTLKKILDNPYKLLSPLVFNGYLNWLSDDRYLSIYYRMQTGSKLNIRNPITFNEKMQWLKLHNRKEVYTKMVDKYEAKKYVSSIIGEKYIIPTLGIWDRFEQIDFNSLPNQFVLKCTHDSGGLVICRDKSQFKYDEAKRIIDKSLARNYYYLCREWPYKNVKPRIIAEKFMDDGHQGLRDYKFFNFNGESKFIYISEGLEKHKTARISFFDFNGKQLPFKRCDYTSFDGDCMLPSNFQEMHNVSDELVKSIDSPFVRTDFYSINDKVYFSEITFSPCGGIIPFSPPSWDRILGEWLSIDERSNDNIF